MDKTKRGFSLPSVFDPAMGALTENFRLVDELIDGGSVILEDTGTATAMAVSLPGVAAYGDIKNRVLFIRKKSGIGTSTSLSLKVNGLSAVSVQRGNSEGTGLTTTFEPHSLSTGQVIAVCYDGNRFAVLNVNCPDRATSSEAKAGTNSYVYMTPVRTKEAVEEFAPPISHADASNKYGAASADKYGHVRVLDMLDSDSEVDALSARQGKLLKGMVNNIQITGGGASYVYNCTGESDDVKISELVNSFYEGTGVFADSVAKSLRLDIVGNVGLSSEPQFGKTEMYRYFDFNNESVSGKWVYIDWGSAHFPNVVPSGNCSLVYNRGDSLLISHDKLNYLFVDSTGYTICNNSNGNVYVSNSRCSIHSLHINEGVTVIIPVPDAVKSETGCVYVENSYCHGISHTRGSLFIDNSYVNGVVNEAYIYISNCYCVNTIRNAYCANITNCRCADVVCASSMRTFINNCRADIDVETDTGALGRVCVSNCYGTLNNNSQGSVYASNFCGTLKNNATGRLFASGCHGSMTNNSSGNLYINNCFCHALVIKPLQQPSYALVGVTVTSGNVYISNSNCRGSQNGIKVVSGTLYINNSSCYGEANYDVLKEAGTMYITSCQCGDIKDISGSSYISNNNSTSVSNSGFMAVCNSNCGSVTNTGTFYATNCVCWDISSSSSIYLNNCRSGRITNNTGTAYITNSYCAYSATGGGTGVEKAVCVTNNLGTLHFVNSYCYARGYLSRPEYNCYGYGLYNSGGTVHINGSTCIGTMNKSINANGVGVYQSAEAGSLFITNSTLIGYKFKDEPTLPAFGLYVESSDAAALVILKNCHFPKIDVADMVQSGLEGATHGVGSVHLEGSGGVGAKYHIVGNVFATPNIRIQGSSVKSVTAAEGKYMPQFANMFGVV